MSLNSCHPQHNQLVKLNQTNPDLACTSYASSDALEEKTVGCSSLRVRFRMITRKNDNFKARISSSISTSSMFSSASTTSSATNLNMLPQQSQQSQAHASHLMNSASLATVANNSASSLSSFNSSSHNQLQRIHHHFNPNSQPTVLEIKQNKQAINHTVFFYNQPNSNSNQQQQQQNQVKRHSLGCRELVIEQPKSIPINIGLTKPTIPACETVTNSNNTKTFRLTEDLKSNIQFDITLKPTFSIRDDKLDASQSNLRSSSCELNSSCSNFDLISEHETTTNQPNNNNNKKIVNIIRNSRHKENETNNSNNKVYHHSSLIRLSINRLNGENSPRNKSHSNLQDSDDLVNTASYTSSSNQISSNNNKIVKRVVSPFTYIETYSSRRQMSISPTNSKQASLT